MKQNADQQAQDEKRSAAKRVGHSQRAGAFLIKSSSMYRVPGMGLAR